MGKILLAFAFAAAFALFGCASDAEPLPADSEGLFFQPEGAGSFLVEESPVDFVARYTVNEGGEETEKVVFRKGRKMRIDYLSGGSIAFSLYLLESEAYSCPRAAADKVCINATGGLTQQQVSFLSAQSPPQGARHDGKTDIGGTEGDCYLVSQPQSLSRRVCYTDKGALAYDEAWAGNEKRVEYATSIAYAASDADFVLPYAVRE